MYESGGIALCIFNLSTRWMQVVSFKTQVLYPQGNYCWWTMERGCVGHRASLDMVGKRKKWVHYLWWKSNPRHPACILVTVLTELPQNLQAQFYVHNLPVVDDICNITCFSNVIVLLLSVSVFIYCTSFNISVNQMVGQIKSYRILHWHVEKYEQNSKCKGISM